MKSRWDSLGDKYAGHPKVLIGDVDCTVHKSVCEKYGVSGYPTLKFFNKDTGEKGLKYTGDRFIEDLEAVVKKELETGGCDVKQPSTCDEKEAAYIKKMQGKSKDDLVKELHRVERLAGGDMAPDKAKWIAARIDLLRQLSSAAKSQD
eukprot:CAMPEP_0115260872 /NCGR_PEP_ID=MMETSP0270-20121206/48562_1 /TAXON_ID=71861 /ORGANISM="Scrippsiella trochoidea, Strain CCMP3099" /LENGTH=147 /DNA_ID=CAMNT_0002676723 /DNA_START=226 /DNA_END=666 /DNA_ORIENTATION=-